MPNTRTTVKIGTLGIMCVCLLVLVVSYIPETSHGESVAQFKADTKATLDRKHDVIKINGELLGRFNGVPIKNLTLLVLKNDKLSPIPFQIDERNRRGRYVMTGGKKKMKDEDNGKLDANDELVFLVRDAGDRLPEKERLAGGKRIEIELTDPRDTKKHAWAYLARYAPPIPRSKTDYVRYIPGKDQIISKRCIMTYRGGFMFYTDMLYPKAGGGSGKDFMDRIKFRIKVDFLGGKVAIERNEEVVLSTVTGFKDGPVRVIRSTNNRIKIFQTLPAIKFASFSEHYPHMTSLPIDVRFPFDLKATAKVLGVRTMRAEVYGDFHDMVGGQAYTNLNPEGFTYTGKSTKEDLKKIKRKGLVWGMVTKKGVGTWFPRLVFPDFIYQYTHYYITDNTSLKKPPEDVPGEVAGGIILDILNFPEEYLDWLGTESYTLTLHTYYPRPGATAEDARKWLDILDYPLFIDVHGGKSTARQTGKKAAGPPWKNGQDGVITDTRDRKIKLKKIAYFVGSVRSTPRFYFLGERVRDQSFHQIHLSKIRSIANRCVKKCPVTKTEMPMFAKVVMKDGKKLDLMSCTTCGWAGSDESGSVIYLTNAQIKRIDFK